MERSEQIGDFAAALAKAQGAIKGAIKNKENPFFKSSYTDLAGVLDACREQLSRNNIAYIQSTQFDADSKWIETMLIHSSGQWVSSRYPVKPVKDDPQGMGSAVTYARRYSLMALAGIVADDDDDGEAASGRPAGNGSAKVAEPVKRPVAPKPEDEAKKWVKEAEATVRAFTRIEELRAWDNRNTAALARLKAIDLQLFDQVNDAVAEGFRRLSPANA